MASSINVIIKKFIILFIYYNCLNLIQFVNTSRADLGTYLHISPAIEEKQQTPEELYVLAFINYTFISDGREVYYSEEKGRYGEGKILNVQGFLEHITSVDDVNDHTACTSQIRGTNGNPLPGGSTSNSLSSSQSSSASSSSSSSSSSTSTSTSTTTNLNSNKPWIALIKRGKCTFEEKIKHAWKHGAVGVIVYNEIPAVSLEKMKIIEKDRNITAIFTYKWIGEELGRIVDEGNHIWVSISEGQRGMRPPHNINKTSVLFVSISFIVLMIISLVWLIFYYIQRFRYLQSKDQHSRHLCAVAKRVIMKIPTKSGKCDDKDNDNDCCAICIEPYKATDCIRVLPCNHEFHKNCIDPWLLEHRTCPMCKLDVLKHYGFVCTLHRHCPAQADRVFWEAFPNRYFGSEESILHLDLDMEIGDNGLNSGDDDRFSIDNPRISHTTPTFHIETFDDHSHLVHNISSESSSNSQRLNDELIPERSQSSLSYINRMLDDSITNKLFPHNQQFLSRNLKDNKNSTTTTTTTVTTVKGNNNSSGTTSTNSNFLSPDVLKKDKESVSLPGTLKKKRASDTCRGSNNCYIKNAANDLKQLAAKIEKGCPKSRTTIVRQASDDEHLLDNDDCTTATNDPNTIPPAVVLSSSSSSAAAATAEPAEAAAASLSLSDTPSQIRNEITPKIDGDNEQQQQQQQNP